MCSTQEQLEKQVSWVIAEKPQVAYEKKGGGGGTSLQNDPDPCLGERWGRGRSVECVGGWTRDLHGGGRRGAAGAWYDGPQQGACARRVRFLRRPDPNGHL